MFGLEYIRPFTWADLKVKRNRLTDVKGVTVVEIKNINEKAAATCTRRC